MAEKKKVMLDDDWNKRIEKAMAQKVTPVKTAKKTVKKAKTKKK